MQQTIDFMPLDGSSARLRSHVVGPVIVISGFGADSQLAPSGGWLGEVVILLSKLIGIWDIFALMIIFVVVWVLIRTVSPIIALPLGLLFDLSIPLQYQSELC